MTSRPLRRRPRRHEMLLAGLSVAGVGAAIALMGTAGASTATGDVRAAGSPTAVRGSYIVVLKDSQVAATAVNSMASTMTRREGGSVRQTWSTSLRGFELRSNLKTARKIAGDPRVAYVEQNQIMRTVADQANPPSFGLDRVDQRDLPVDDQFTTANNGNGVEAWIIDSGIRVTHQDFGGRATFAFNGIDDIDTDCNGHGTHVAGTVGGKNFGMAKAVKLFAVKVVDCDGAGDAASVINGVNFVTQNAKKPAVANMSIGGPAVAAIDTAVAGSIRSGVTYSVAAGNENQNACNDSPARLGAAITVGATDQDDQRADFSNFGNCVDIFAPGVDITSDFANANNATQVLSGTSMSTPHVTGAAALLLAKNRNLSPQQVRNALVANATDGVVADTAGSPNRLLFVGED